MADVVIEGTGRNSRTGDRYTLSAEASCVKVKPTGHFSFTEASNSGLLTTTMSSITAKMVNLSSFPFKRARIVFSNVTVERASAPTLNNCKARLQVTQRPGYFSVSLVITKGLQQVYSHNGSFSGNFMLTRNVNCTS